MWRFQRYPKVNEKCVRNAVKLCFAAAAVVALILVFGDGLLWLDLHWFTLSQKLVQHIVGQSTWRTK